MKRLIILVSSIFIASNANAYEYNSNLWGYASSLTSQDAMNTITADTNSIYADMTSNGAAYSMDNLMIAFENAIINYGQENTDSFTIGSTTHSHSGTGVAHSMPNYNMTNRCSYEGIESEWGCNQENYNNYVDTHIDSTLAAQFDAAHADGWKGQHIKLRVNGFVYEELGSNDGDTGIQANHLAPHAYHRGLKNHEVPGINPNHADWNDVYYEVQRGPWWATYDSNLFITSGDETTNWSHRIRVETDLDVAGDYSKTQKAAIIAAGTAIVWSKYDTLSKSDLITVMTETAVNGNMHLTHALSPVGNLN